ncbi:MAG TPA: carbamoyltransferase HypF [Ktedonobacteraceae bacterium]|nr:carbamoyltransferase HypF [Ktedonobacteraceae bacterium]
MTGPADGEVLQRRRLLVQGIIQGVGFRPFVYTQAQRLGLAGFVRNDSSGVTIEIEGPQNALDTFQRALSEEAPPLARVDQVTIERLPTRHETTFIIMPSKASEEHHTLISPDVALCNDCLHELSEPTNRRYHYPFINCTNCGPRFTIIQNMPYDRDKTTMRAFPLCPTCRAEYDDPLNRRFHAQPNACPACGPQLQLLLWDGAETSSTDSEEGVHAQEALTQASHALVAGAVLAIKGLGGYHLACDALNVAAVRRLRLRKQRELKPFALMVPDLETARFFCHVSDAEAALLQSRQRPIVLLPRRPDRPLAPDVAPHLGTLGIMLPYTPLHYLLLHTFADASPPGRPVALVMTSGNLSEEPLAYRDEEAKERLGQLAEGMLLHNREIYTRCDDSVVRIVAGGVQFFRRARGYVPEPLALSFEAPLPLLACGGQLKNTFCLSKGRQAFLSQHIGDLENLETLASFQESIEHFQRLFAISPQAVAYDLHPEYLASKYALDLDVPQKIGVQHHHAHIASVLAEHGLEEPVIGVAADGTGYGTDGAIWGCEVMCADRRGFQRLAHLAYVPLPGGERAIRQPWRMAAVYLQRACGADLFDLNIPFVRRLDRAKWRILEQMIARGLNCPLTSSLGRLFDAVAALLDLPAGSSHQLYEGQAASELEQLAITATDAGATYPFAINDQAPAALDVTPLIHALVADIRRGVPAPHIAHRFHSSIGELLAQTCVIARERTGLHTVALSGGVFQNRLLLEELIGKLKSLAFRVYINRHVPPNDGGLSLGQIAVAAARLQISPQTEVVPAYGFKQEQEISDVPWYPR